MPNPFTNDDYKLIPPSTNITSSEATLVVAVAQSWLGASQSGGKSSNGTTYAEIMRIFNTNGSYSYDGQGCCEFCCACFIKALGLERAKKVIPIINYSNGQAQKFGSLSKKPELACVMYFDYHDGNGISHVELVTEVLSPTMVKTIDGNATHSVIEREREINGQYVAGFGIPKFSKAPYNPNGDFSGGSGGTSFNEPAPGNNITITDYNWKKAAKNYNFPKSYDYEVISEDVNVTKNFQGIQTAEGDIRRVQGTKLLSYPSLVEVPFVILKVGDYTFGSYTKGGDLNTIARVTYPNFIDGMTVVKVNGTVNQYTINLTYQIEAGNDPNLVDKILSKVGYGLVYISYGDWACPTFIYSEEEALITNVRSKVDFSRSIISYTITCTSNSITLAANMFNFPARNAKPSDIIFEMLQNKQYGLTNMFTGMRNISKIRAKGLIASNDIKVEIPSKEGMDPLSYLNYLVSCMTPIGNDFHSILKDSTYYMTIKDDTRGDLGGPYFAVTEVKSQTKTLSTVDTYEVDVGFPNDDFVTQFSVDTDNSWSLLYAYADRVNNQNYVYSLDDNGNILTKYSPNITTSTTGFITTAAQKNWWTQMTQFPIKATLEIKGLLRPSMLMSYIRVNAFFYGQKHISSGLYIITKQVDNINRNGYKTTLSLTRIGGDDDVITNVTKTVTTQKPAIITSNNSRNYGYGVGANGEFYNINSANVYTKGGGMNTNSTMEQ